jgi:hypothetical protein
MDQSTYAAVIGYIFLFFLPLLLTVLFKTRFAGLFATLFAPRRHNDLTETNLHGVVDRNKELTLIKSFDNPFSLSLDSKSNGKDGLFLNILRANKSAYFNMVVAWSVNISNFYECIEQDYMECFFDSEKLFLSNHSMHTEFHKLDNDEENLSEMHFPIPETCVDAFLLETNKDQMKTTYPVVVCIYNEKEKLDQFRPDEIIASIWVIHLKDRKMSNKILYNYNKCLNNRIIIANTIYAPQADDICVACQTELSNVVLLPCIHKCLCKDCYDRCNKQCPVCRTKIVNIFRV